MPIRTVSAKYTPVCRRQQGRPERIIVSSTRALFCCSVDGIENESLSTEVAGRCRDVVALLEELGIPSNWTTSGFSSAQLPQGGERTVHVPKGLNRQELIQCLRQHQSRLLGNGELLTSVVLDPHEAKKHWDILVRHGCRVARPRTAEVTRNTGPRIVRGGLWAAPLTCSFVGGTRRSVRSLVGVCQKRLIRNARDGQLFHLNIDVDRSRKSWDAECGALRAIMTLAADLRSEGQIACVQLGELPACVTQKPSKPMLSILRAA